MNLKKLERFTYLLLALFMVALPLIILVFDSPNNVVMIYFGVALSIVYLSKGILSFLLRRQIDYVYFIASIAIIAIIIYV
ncbi:MULTISPECIES: hypothetical protein [Pontibacillus]|uniref:Uncharacterized protein n=1 Tax=Pontibacillus chungwhensis TaxID=265426 RepID=A0ABY8V2J2_9BACI|nr:MULTISPECIES: hypothetical protein [Pontibacillus]MCD5322184.1 hypothetical protein [Pontibacillus sp. HN14]WIF99477.1 hypothetical protein QNI29_07420 [Pontibacillus chungwhensis]